MSKLDMHNLNINNAKVQGELFYFFVVLRYILKLASKVRTVMQQCFRCNS